MSKIIVRVPNWLGDAVLSTPALHLLRQKFPRSYIVVMAKEWVGPVFKFNPDVNDTFVIPEEKGYRWMARNLREDNFDLGILFPNSFSSAFLFWLARITERVGYATDGRSLFLTEGIKRSPIFRREHQVRYYLHLVEQTGSNALAASDQHSTIGEESLVWNITAEEDKWAQERLKHLGLSPEDRIVGINPGATYGSAKRWFPDRFAKLADELSKRYEARVVVFGSGEEKGIANSIVNLTEIKPVNLAGQTNLRQLAALISKCVLFITNDTGTMHVAAAVKIPVVAIFGSTDPVRTGPWGEGHIIVREEVPCSPCLEKECPRGDYLCFEKIRVEDVLKAAEKQLAKGGTGL